ncbi:origin recognition complex subunit 3 [Neocloeon triangulifer]|uniref:origin recognition complex subunit 3 n=1 Tax=Neocloeon triangulifer TaxID=2078957 RepID=UPI00286F65AF|nr:origin recognition complex subunit 3 [Neocloeon triangulifer]
MESSMETSSMSTGVFVYKRKKSKTRSSGSPYKGSPYKGSPNKARRAVHVEMTGYPSEPWYPAYKSVLTSLEDEVEKMYSQMFAQLLENVSSFFESKSSAKNANEIPTACILTGINLPDHSIIYNALEKRLVSDVTPHVVLLSSRTCSTTRHLLGQILNKCQFGEFEMDVESADDSDCEFAGNQSRKRAIKCTFADVVDWYNNQGSEKPIIVVLTDFEAFASNVLGDFIYLASEHRKVLPMALVFGVATTETAVHDSLPHRIMSRLAMETFATKNSKEFLNHLINEVILTPKCLFRLGGDVFRMLTDIFLFYDFSIQSFLQKFKFCLLTHFADKGIFALYSKEDLTIEIMKSKELAKSIVPKLKSYRKFVEKHQGEEKLNLLTNDEHIKDTLICLATGLLEHFNYFLVGLKCLLEMTAFLPQQPLGRQLSDMYFEAVSQKVWLKPEYIKCVSLWKHLSGVEMEEKVDKLLEILEESLGDLPDLEEWITKITAANEKLKKIFSGQKSASCSPKKQNKPTELSGLSRIQLQQQLKELSKSSPSQNKFELARDEVIKSIEQMLKTLLVPPKELPLHELLLFDNLDLAKKELMGNSRLALNKALFNPHHYLKCKCCEQKYEEGISTSYPDVCISYHLHLEFMKHINLYDWLQSFNLIVERGGKHDDDEEEDCKISTKTQARFTQSIADLQFLGFIKPTARKADHVLRLTWGNNCA